MLLTRVSIEAVNKNAFPIAIRKALHLKLIKKSKSIIEWFLSVRCFYWIVKNFQNAL